MYSVINYAYSVIDHLYFFIYIRWNQLDVVIVFLSIIGIIFEELNSSLPINPTIIRIMRVLRIARVLKILKAAAGIQKLLNCVSEAIPQVQSVLCTLNASFTLTIAVCVPSKRELFVDRLDKTLCFSRLVIRVWMNDLTY